MRIGIDAMGYYDGYVSWRRILVNLIDNILLDTKNEYVLFLNEKHKHLRLPTPKNSRKKFFHGKFVGYSDTQKSITFPSLIKNYVTEIPFFVKCDIEGWEYRILNDLVEYAPHITGAVIEFHDVDLHRERILEFLKKFPLTLVHFHPNNSAGVDKNNDPIMVEMSFARNPVPINSLPCKLPHPLDMPCSTRVPDISIG